jgi:ANTAR domain-containing protein/GAF domain-containing protein
VTRRGALTSTLLAIARDVGDDRELAGLICRAFVNGLDVDGAALSLLTARLTRHTLYASDATAQLLEELQFTLNEGACIEAAMSGHPTFVDDIREPAEMARWPVFATAVLEQTDVRRLYALPLQWGTTNLGVLDLYRREPPGLDGAQRREALAATDTAALMMLTLRTEPTELAGLADGSGGSWLEPMVASRAEVHQATGMVMVQLGLSAADALARIRAHAFVHQQLLIDVAHEVVARRLSFTDDVH